MDADIGLGLPVAQPGVEYTLLFELQEKLSVALPLFIVHGGFRGTTIIKAVDVVGAVDNSRFGRYRRSNNSRTARSSEPGRSFG